MEPADASGQRNVGVVTAHRESSTWTRIRLPRSGEVDVHARAAGPAGEDAPVVVLVHGIAASSRYMVPTLRALAPHCRVLAPDLPGFGRSGKPSHVLDITGLAEALAAWAEARDLPPATFLASSFGCEIAVEHATRHPGRVSRLVLQGPTLDPSARSPVASAVRWLQDGRREPRSLARVLLRDAFDCGVRRAIGTFRAALDDPLEEKLPRVLSPTLVVRGADDPIVPQAWAEEVTRLLPHGRLIVLPGVAHALNYSAPDALARVVLPFLRGEPVGATVTGGRHRA